MKKIFNCIIYSLLLGVVPLLGLSCADDLGNYEYHDINEVKITGIEKSYSIFTGETITIKPVIDSSITSDEEADYTYQWVWVNANYKNKDYNRLIWSRKKEWDNHNLGLAGGKTYTFYYLVKDEKTGISWMSDNFTIYIENDISLGIFVLSDVNDVGRVDFINYVGRSKFDLRLDILNAIGTELPPLDKPLGVVCWLENNSPYWGANSNSDHYMIGVLTETGGYRLHPFTFAYEDSYNWLNAFLAENKLPSDFYVKNVFTHGASGSSFFATLDNNNNVYYTYSALSHFATANIYTNQTSSNVKINVSPQMVFTPYGVVCYDTDTKSFVSQGGTNSTYLVYYAPSLEKEHERNGETLLFKYNNTGKDLVFMDFRYTDSGFANTMHNVYAVLKDPNTGEMFLACFTGMASTASNKGIQRFYYALKGLPELSEAVEFAITRRANPNNNYANSILYYRTNQRIYAYNMSDGTTRLVYPLNGVSQDGYTQISRMKFFPCSVTATAWLRDRLAICTYNPTEPAESCGRLQIAYTATDSNTGELFLMENSADSEKLDWTGFGKIIDLDLKNK